MITDILGAAFLLLGDLPNLTIYIDFGPCCLMYCLWSGLTSNLEKVDGLNMAIRWVFFTFKLRHGEIDIGHHGCICKSPFVVFEQLAVSCSGPSCKFICVYLAIST